MITSISLSNFKCFNAVRTFQLGKINVFTGYNGRGKSSVFQSFFLLAQSYYRNGDVKTLELNGDMVQLDLFEDLINKDDPSNEALPVSIVLGSDSEESKVVELGYIKKEKRERQGDLIILKVTSRAGEKDYSLHEAASLGDKGEFKEQVRRGISGYPENINEIFENVFFSSADRRGPALFEEKHDLSAHNPLGKNGEYLLNVISGDNNLIEEINSAISYIMDGGKIILDGGSDKKTPVLSLNFMIGDNTKSTYKSINCGYGYSYILPIIVNALTMSKGMLFIENPEAHLHPKAQSHLVRFLCNQLQKKDVQIFIETHSEHILNAVRLCTLIKEKYTLSNKDVNLYFFDRDFDCKKLELDGDAQISNWPNGFFDQQETDLTEILKRGIFNEC